MNRPFTAVAAAALLAAILPATVSAAGVTKYTEHAVSMFCESPIDGGFVSSSAGSSTAFGDGGELNLWLDPATFEDPPTVAGSLTAVAFVQSGTDVVGTATFALHDADGLEIGEGTLAATLVAEGAPVPFDPPAPSNHHYGTTGAMQQLVGTGTITLPGLEAIVPCFGEIRDVDVHEANPSSFVFSDGGLVLTCFWETADAVAILEVTDTVFGLNAEAVLIGPTLTIFTRSWSGSIDINGTAATFQLLDEATGDLYGATAAADFTPVGTPVTSKVITQNSTKKLVEQSLRPAGSIDFSTGDSFAINEEHCDASQYESHLVQTSPKGPKPGAPLANDAPEDAIALEPGDRFNVQIGGEALEAEVPTDTCPEGFFDRMGHTIWYTIEGTGGPITFDTAGSNFDTVLAVYVREGDGFTELACVDDVFYEPIGISLQAAITGDTELGVTYYVQVGGFQNFRSLVTEFGRLRVRVS